MRHRGIFTYSSVTVYIFYMLDFILKYFVKVQHILFYLIIVHLSNTHASRSVSMIRKLSKIETLRLASSYISHLGNVLLLGEGLHDGQPCHAPSPPFFHVNSSPTRGSDQSAQPKHICTFCLSNQRKMVSRQKCQIKKREKTGQTDRNKTAAYTKILH